MSCWGVKGRQGNLMDVGFKPGTFQTAVHALTTETLWMMIIYFKFDGVIFMTSEKVFMFFFYNIDFFFFFI